MLEIRAMSVPVALMWDVLRFTTKVDMLRFRLCVEGHAIDARGTASAGFQLSRAFYSCKLSQVLFQRPYEVVRPC